MQPHDVLAHRYDYAKFLLRGPLDLCEHYKLHFVQTIAAGDEDTDGTSGYKAQPVCRHADGQWTYTYEIWGPLSAVVRFLDWNQWSKICHRLDIRWDTDVTTSGIRALRDQLEQGGSGGRNVHTFNSRVRNKKDGRDSGGFGVAVGSHKSELRFSAYKRGSEKGACEFQLSGKRIKTAMSVVNMEITEGDKLTRTDPWSTLRIKLLSNALRTLREGSKLNIEEVHTVLTTGLSDTPVERSLREIERHIEVLDRTGLEVARGLVQERLALDF